MGRPNTKFSEEQREAIKKMAGYGTPHKHIARIFETSEKTLRKHCKDELDTGGALATAKVAESLYNQAINGNTTACIFWLKTRAGWCERHEVTGKNGRDLMSTKLTLEQRVDLGKRLAFSLAEAAHNMTDENTEPKV